MKGRRANVVLGTAVFTLLLILCLQPHEPFYQGRPLTAWLAEWDTGFGSSTRPIPAEQDAKPEYAIRQMGPSALPSLRKMLRTHDTEIRHKVVAFCRVSETRTTVYSTRRS